jgi:hypothetical protein
VFFQKRAGRSARYDRRVRNAEAAGSNPARSIPNQVQAIRIVISPTRLFI